MDRIDPFAEDHIAPVEVTSALDGVAIIGMAGRFPGAADLEAFWRNLVAGTDSITHFSPEQVEASNLSSRDAGADYVAARGVLDDAAMFDAEYFGISPREAERMDPQHRLFLETCSNALEDGGYGRPDYRGEIGLFAGCSLNTYLLANLMADRAALEELSGSYQVGEFQVALGNDKDFLTTRVAYKLNLRGPCVSVQSACATSLVAICQASQALLNYQCDMALAGGVSVTFPQHRGHVYSEGGIVSKDGHCRPFDAEATGTVFGHGVGAVVLKRVEDALRDGDRIAAVIRGFAVNNDGSAKAGYMAPGVDGQMRVIRAAQAMAGIHPETISYVEAHGTGTPLGDPIEIAALTEAFRAGTEKTGFCAVGTAKGNVGHLDSAAGVTGTIKTVLSLQHRTLPGLAHFQTPNPNIALAGSPFRFDAETKEWTSPHPLRAGVSGFGVGGVNAHIVLEEAPAQQSGTSVRERQVLCVSGRSEAAARRAAENLGLFLSEHPATSLADAGFTLAVGRQSHEFRIGIAAASTAEAAAALRAATPVRARARETAWLFPGQGTQFPGMGKSLYDSEAVYRDVVDECAAVLMPVLGLDLRRLLFADAADGEAATALEQTGIAQPAIYVTELALATLWQSWGVTPTAMLGHSLGEYVAATLAGVFSRDEALNLVATRARLMQALPAGAMLSVAAGEAIVSGYVRDGISVAALNSARASVLSGEPAAIDQVAQELEQAGIATRRLHTSHAFHSALMEPMLAPFAEAVARVRLQPPTKRFVSSVSGTWITAAEATDPAYWVEQCRRPVRFRAALECLVEGSSAVLLEVGPGDVLVRLSMQQATGLAAVACLAGARGELPAITAEDALARLWCAGCAPDWTGYFSQEQRLRVSLPTYPFERKLHWVAPPQKTERTTQDPGPTTATLVAPQEMPAMTNPSPASAAVARGVRIRTRIIEVLRELSGIDITPDEAEVSFLELGFDSLFLTQATQSLSKAFATKLTFRQLMEQFSSVAGLGAHLDSILPATAFAEPAPVTAAPPAAIATGAVAQQPMDRLLADQLATLSRLFAEQVATLQSVAGLAPAVAVSAPAPAPAKPVAPAPAAGDSGEVRFSSQRATQKTSQELTPAQQQYIDALVARYERKTPESKRLTAAGRPMLADPRAVSGFRPQWKEMVYPLVVERARGSRLWDVDGNEYIDIVNGYGCIMFGHSPEFVVAAAREQLDRGVAIGPQTPLAAEVAEIICELTGNERVTFCNTGSEAVMAAIRVARTVTGRDKIVYFTGDYHGTFDEVLIRNTPRGSAPLAPGIPLANVTNVVVLDYGTDASLEFIRANAEEIAAVIIEPVQTRHPENQPVEFMRSIRTLTEQGGSAMIIDEVVTGFRLAPGGAQEHFGIRADMCTYGKVIGGGHPIGVLSGKREYLDALDGGAWHYGDDSSPEVGVTFFAGTFVRHPLAMAAARAVLRHLREAGPGLQRDLNAKTAKLAESLDRFFVERGVPSRIHHFASWFYFTFPNDARLGSLLYYSLRAKGIHIQEGYPCFLTTAHTDEDLAAIEAAFRVTILEMQEAGVLPSTSSPTAADVASVLPDGEPQRVPLTEPQREIFLAAHLSDEANCAFNESLTLDLRGPIREAELVVAMELVHARHDALRSTVSEDGDWLIVGHEFKSRIDLRDLTALDAEAQQQILFEAIEREAGMPFDLIAGPLIRSTCFRLAADHAVLVMTAHHIVLDGWSANLLLEEVGKVYSKGAAAESELAPLMPFSRYAIDERRREDEGAFADNEAFWVKTFAGRQPRLELPTDRPRPAEKSYAGSTFSGHLGAEAYVELKKASAKAGCSLYVTLLAGFEMLMHRLTGQDEVVVGISTAGQALVEDTSLVGHCVHFLPMLSQLAEGEIVKDYLRKTRTALLDAYDHQEFTYGSLLRKLKLEREPGRLPLIEVQFNLERVGSNVVFDGLEVSMKANAKRFVNTDLFLNVVETANDLEFSCDFNTTLFDEATIDRWMQSWAELLLASARDAATRVDELPLLNARERQRVLHDWNQTARDFGAFEPLVSSFLRRAEESPERVALVCNGVEWTCSRLASFARSLAARLVDEGMEPGGLVGIAVKRSPEMVGAMLAVMMAGGAYVPLDPRHPQERLEAVLADAGVNIVLTTGALPLKTSARMLELRTLQLVPNPSFEPLAISAASLAYVIYTSGSTGVPKGVAIEHGALMNLLRSMQREPGLTADDTLVAITTLAFDIAALELLLPLLTGARLVIANEEEVVDGVMLLALLERVKATVLQATPGAWRILLDAGWSGRQPLKALCGGEALPRDLAETLVDHARELWNVYGPTETTIWSSATRVVHGTGPLPIGPPIANTQFYVLDSRRQPVAVGSTGELFIGGEGLARGYWNRPELTAEKFVANTFAPGRMYATGDLARFQPDGLIELLGRADFQVKVRGYRIELAEIETALCRHVQVREAVVIQQKPDGVATPRLVAYVATGYNGEDPRAAQLLRELPAALAATLPDYMMPSLVIVLEKLPRTPNGKIDRKGLPPAGVSLSLEREGAAQAFAPPTTPTEILLAGIWCDVLQLDAVSLHTSIFELGADSLLIFRIAAKAQRAGLALKATSIFQLRTIATIVAGLGAAGPGVTSSGKASPAESGADWVPTRIAPASRDRYKLPRVKADA